LDRSIDRRQDKNKGLEKIEKETENFFKKIDSIESYAKNREIHDLNKIASATKTKPKPKPIINPTVVPIVTTKPTVITTNPTTTNKPIITTRTKPTTTTTNTVVHELDKIEEETKSFFVKIWHGITALFSTLLNKFTSLKAYLFNHNDINKETWVEKYIFPAVLILSLITILIIFIVLSKAIISKCSGIKGI